MQRKFRDRFEETYLNKVTWENCAGSGCGATNNLQIFSCGAKDELGKRGVFDIRRLIYCLRVVCMNECLTHLTVFCELSGVTWMSRLQEPGKLQLCPAAARIAVHSFPEPHAKVWPNVKHNTDSLAQFWPSWFWASSNGCVKVCSEVWSSYMRTGSGLWHLMVKQLTQMFPKDKVYFFILILHTCFVCNLILQLRNLKG